MKVHCAILGCDRNDAILGACGQGPYFLTRVVLVNAKSFKEVLCNNHFAVWCGAVIRAALHY
jgi:hypothetical protein